MHPERLSSATPLPSRPEDEPHVEERPIRLLLLSDQLLMRTGLRGLLEGSGIVLIGEAADCEQLVLLAKRERPDVILIDLYYRSETFACVEAVLAAAAESRVIALSDRTRVADHSALVELGVLGLVLKSERPEVLIKAIRKVSAGELWLDRANTAQILRGITKRRRTEDAEKTKIASLTKREHEIVALVGEGLKNAAIAQRSFISEATVRNHLTSILNKLGLSDRFELAVYAFRHGLVRYDDQRPSTPEHIGKS